MSARFPRVILPVGATGLLLILGLGCGTTPAPDPNPNTNTDPIVATGTGTVNGYVYVPPRARQTGGAAVITSQPLSLAEQQAQGVYPAPNARVVTDTRQACTTTGAGAYSIVGVPAGSRSLTVEGADGQVLAQNVSVDVRDADTTSGTTGSTSTTGTAIGFLIGEPSVSYSAGSGAQFEWKNVQFSPGNVGDGLGRLKPIRGATVTLDGQSAETDEDGFFWFMDLTPGTYTATALGHSASVRIVAGRTTSITDDDAATLGTVQGYVYTPNARDLGDLWFSATQPTSGTPAAAAWVVLETGQIAIADDNGRFELLGVPLGLQLVAAVAFEDDEFENIAVGQAYVTGSGTARVGDFPAGFVGQIELDNPLGRAIDVGESVELDFYALTSTDDVVFDCDWASSNTGVLWVNDFGIVTGQSAGSATITASAGGRSMSVTIDVVGSGAGATFPDTILFSDGLDLWLARGSSSNLVQLTDFLSDTATDVASVLMADVRADGAIIFQGLSDWEDNYDLYFMSSPSATPVNVTQTPMVDEWGPRFSHGGQLICYSADFTAVDGTDQSVLVVSDPGGASPQVLSPPGWSIALGGAFSPDDAHIAAPISDISGVGAAVRGMILGEPWSLPGLGQVRARQLPGDVGIATFEVATGLVSGFIDTGLELPSGVDWGPDWTIAYTAWTGVTADDDSAEVFAAIPPDYIPDQLTVDGLPKFMPSLSPDGLSVAFALNPFPDSAEVDIDIGQVDLAGTEARYLLASTDLEIGPRWFRE